MLRKQKELLKKELLKLGVPIETIEAIVSRVSKGQEGFIYDEVNEFITYKGEIRSLEEVIETIKTKDNIDFIEYTESIVSPEDKMNYIIEGDNLAVMEVLKKQNKKYDVVFMNPPYNTESVLDSNMLVLKNKNGKSAKNVWSSFIHKRLKSAYDLMKDDSLLFFIVDEENIHRAKHLVEDVFGEENYMNTVIMKTSNYVNGARIRTVNKNIIKTKEYLLITSKNKGSINNLKPLKTFGGEIINKRYTTYIDEDLKPKRTLDVFNEDEILKEKINGNITFDKLNFVLRDNKTLTEYVLNEYKDKIFTDSRFTINITDESINRRLNNGETVKYNDYIIRKTKNGKGTIRYFSSLSEKIGVSDDYEEIEGHVHYVGDVWDFSKDMSNIQQEGKINYKNNKKPVRLLKNILKLYNKKDADVLDLFAGSGTTAHAVAELNHKEGYDMTYTLINIQEILYDDMYEYFKKEYSMSKRKFNNLITSGNIKDYIEFNEKDFEKLTIINTKTMKRIYNITNGYRIRGREEKYPHNYKLMKL